MRKGLTFKDNQTIKRTEAFNIAAGVLSEYIKGLPLSQPANN
jgi:hypothetical protein